MELINSLKENPDKPSLREDQKGDLIWHIQNPRGMNLSDPGTGKTPTICYYIQYLWQYKNTKTVWSMPKSLLWKNFYELLRFTDFREEDIVVIDGTPKQRQVQIERSSGKVFLCGFTRFAKDWKNMLNHHDDLNCHVIDEFHLGFSTDSSARTKQMFYAARKFDHFLPMSGTLITGRLDSAYPAIHVIEPRYYASAGAFRNYHAEYDLDGNIVQWRNFEKIGHIFNRHSIRHTFEEVYGEVDIVEQVRRVEMSPKQRKAYDQLHEEAVVELEDMMLTATEPGVQAIRARQIMACPEIFGIATDETTGKDEQLIIDLEDHKRSGKPFIIFAALEPEIERIADLCRKMEFKVGVMYGKVQKGRAQIDRDFQEGKLDGVIATQKVASAGYNWPHVDHIMQVSLNYEDSDYTQSIRRAVRGVRTAPLRVSIYKYTNSIEHHIFRVIDRKSRDRHAVDPSYKILNLSQL